MFPLRLTGPSMRFISTALPALLTPRNIFQLCIFRAFAFGDVSRLQQLVLPPPTESQGEEHYNDKEPGFDTLLGIIGDWTGSTGKQISLSVYGRFQIIISKAPSMLSLLWSFSKAVNLLSHSSASPSALPTFASVYSLLAEYKVPSLPHGGLLLWLITSDLAEYGLCAMPKVDDLVDHMLSKGRSSG